MRLPAHRILGPVHKCTTATIGHDGNPIESHKESGAVAGKHSLGNATAQELVCPEHMEDREPARSMGKDLWLEVKSPAIGLLQVELRPDGAGEAASGWG